MSKFIKLIPEPLCQTARLYFNDEIVLTENRSGSQTKLLKDTLQLIKWMTDHHLCEPSWVDLMYKILSKFKLNILVHFRKLFPKITSTKMAQWKKYGGKIIRLLLQIGWKINKNFKYDDLSFKGLDAFIQNSLSGDEAKVKQQQPEEVEFGQIELPMYRFLYKAVAWLNKIHTKMEQKFGIKLDLQNPLQKIHQIQSSFEPSQFQEELTEYEQLKNDQDYIKQFLEKRMNCFQIQFYKEVKAKGYQKFTDFLNILLLKNNSPKKQLNSPNQPFEKSALKNQLYEQEDSAFTTATTKNVKIKTEDSVTMKNTALTKAIAKNVEIKTEDSVMMKSKAKQYKSKAIQTELRVQELRLEQIDISKIIQSRISSDSQEGEIGIEYEYFRRPILKKQGKQIEVKTEFEVSKKEQLMSKKKEKESQKSGKLANEGARQSFTRANVLKERKLINLYDI